MTPAHVLHFLVAHEDTILAVAGLCISEALPHVTNGRVASILQLALRGIEALRSLHTVPAARAPQSIVTRPEPQKGTAMPNPNTVALLGVFPASAVTLNGAPPTLADGSPAPGPIVAASIPGADHGNAQVFIDLAGAVLPLIAPGAKVTADSLTPLLAALGRDLHQPAVEALAAIAPDFANASGKSLEDPFFWMFEAPKLYATLRTAGIIKA